MTQEALKLALDALEVATTPLAKDRQKVLRAITAIKEALAQTQEPDDIASILACRDMLDAQPVPPRTEQEPMQFKIVVIDNHHPNGIPYEHWVKTPQRTWVDLTSEDWNEIFGNALNKVEAIKLTKAKLKEKNK
jgi:hypothetical protein